MQADPINMYFLGKASRSARFAYNEVHGYVKVRARPLAPPIKAGRQPCSDQAERAERYTLGCLYQ